MKPLSHRVIRQLFLAACVLLGNLLPATATESYSFSVVPQFERRMLFSIWQPIVDQLEKRTGLHLHLVTSLSVSDYESDVQKGQYDFIYLNPYMMPVVTETPGYIPLVRDARPIHGILVVRKDSPLQKVSDLQGKTLAVPSMTALGASLLLRAELDRQFGVQPKVIIAKTHSSVFLHVINGFADAGGSVQKTLGEQDARIQGALRVLHRTVAVPSHPLAAHRRVPVEVREKLRQAFIDLASSEEGRALLEKVPMQSPVAAQIGDYDVLKSLKLENYLEQP